MNTCKLSWWTPKIFPHKKFKNWLYSTSHLPSRCKVHSSQITIRQPLTHISDGAIYSRIKTLLNLLSRDIKALNSFSRSRLVCRAHFDDKLCLSPFLLKIITLESLWKDFVAFHRKTRQLGGGWRVEMFMPNDVGCLLSARWAAKFCWCLEGCAVSPELRRDNIVSFRVSEGILIGEQYANLPHPSAGDEEKRKINIRKELN